MTDFECPICHEQTTEEFAQLQPGREPYRLLSEAWEKKEGTD